MTGLRLAGLTLLCVWLFFLAGCGESEDGSDLGTAEVLAKASEKAKAENSLHFKLESQGGSTPIVAGLGMDMAEGDVVKPDKMKVMVKASFLKQAIDVGFVSLGAESYMTNPLSGKWESFPIGTNPIGGVKTYHIRGLVPASALKSIVGDNVEEGDVRTEVWIAKKDFLPHQFRLEGAVIKGEQPEIVRLLVFSRFDQAVTIEAPK